MKKATSHIPSHQLPERWFLVDATDQMLGKLAVGVAKLLMGKDQPSFNPAVDAKTNVVVINSEKIKLSGLKLDQKVYRHHSGYPGGLREQTAREILEGKYPERLIINAVEGMLPRNTLAKTSLSRLKAYVGAEHPHAGQQPIEIKLS